ncbi:presenilin [Echinococcus multilocularis]|uniref:Presenilin n=1 Tax=Echinococcus multilocularis TaxID=6211 RepID=A0A068YDE2_ECHMU|nr:presenilin [Echinococcus multilocularis]
MSSVGCSSPNQYAHLNGRPSTSGDQQLRAANETGCSSVDPKLIIRIGAKQIISLFIPVSICMFLVVFISKTVPYFSTTDVYLIYTPFHTPNADIGTQTWQTLANVVIFLSVIVVMTFLLVLLFKFKCYKCLTGWLVATTFLLVFVISFTFFTELLRASMIFFDNITFAILLWNFGVLGLISIHWRSPLILQQAYLIFNSVQMALIFLKFLPKWTCWVLLGALAIWDLIAVLCPRGPLRMLVEMAQERNQPLFPAMVYSTTTAYIATTQPVAMMGDEETHSTHLGPAVKPTEEHACLSQPSPQQPSSLAPLLEMGNLSGNSTQPSGMANDLSHSEGQQSNQGEGNTNQQEQCDFTPPLTVDSVEPRLHEMQSGHGGEQPESANDHLRDLQENVIEREERGVKLGLGDFIFYSLLIGRASLDGDVLTAVACYIAILVGMCLTIVALGVARKALPALPISIACGIVFYFSTAVVITPFIRATSEKRLFF